MMRGLANKLPPGIAEHLERIIFLKQIGTTIGPCWVVSGCILVFAIRAGCHALGLPTVAVGVILMALGWVKLLQEHVYLQEWVEDYGGRQESWWRPKCVSSSKEDS